MKKRTSLIWKIPKDNLIELVKKSNTISEILSAFLLKNKGHNYRTLKKRLLEDNIDFSHINLGLSANKGRKVGRANGNGFPLKEILIENSTYTNRGRLKIRLINEKHLINQCKNCGQLPEWKGKQLSLQIDHINGIPNDNRLENLRLLCPNCHSQTENFAGKNKPKHRQNKV